MNVISDERELIKNVKSSDDDKELIKTELDLINEQISEEKNPLIKAGLKFKASVIGMRLGKNLKTH